MQEQSRWTLTGLYDVNAMPAACLYRPAPHSQTVEYLPLCPQDLVRVGTAEFRARSWMLVRPHTGHTDSAQQREPVRIPNRRVWEAERDDGVVTGHDSDDYCAFTKALEHLADRWSLLVVAELVESSPRGFNALATGVPGRISRSVLADRLRRLERLGIVARDVGESNGSNYRLTAVGRGLTPTLLSLREWAFTWLPDDPAAAEHDPDVIFAWLTRRIKEASLPARPTVIELRTHFERPHRCWLVIERGREPYGCFRDPLLDETRYIYVTAALPVLLALAHGTRSWADALAEASIIASGDPDLLSRLPDWFD